MFDTMTMTKVIGGLCGTFLIFLLGKWAAEVVYHVGTDAGHGEEHAMAYPIEVDESGDTGGGEESADFATVFASADAGRGERVWGKCRACHKLEDGANGTGPHLFNVVGRDIGSVGDYSYSGVLTELPGDWTPEALNAFLESPRDYASGTKMSFAGLPSVEDRANLIAYLQAGG